MRPSRQPQKNRDCPTQKLRLPDHKAAVSRLQMLQWNHPTREYLPVRVYECEFCKGWHLTSKER
jgi:hypothetical protein